MVKKLGKLAIAVVAGFVLLSSCATMERSVPQRKNANADFVFGRLDLSAVHDSLSFVSMLHYPYRARLPFVGRASDVPFRILPDGTFYAANVDPGKYVLWEFLGDPTSIFSNHAYDVFSMTKHTPPHFTESDAVDFQPDSLSFLGAWKVKLEKNSSTSTSFKFTINEDKNLSEADILREILPYTKGTAWNAMIRKKLGIPPTSQGS